jgi:hypothetical protein
MLDGTDANGAGLFRVLLHVEDKEGHQDWASQGLTVVSHWHDAGNLSPGNRSTNPGLDYQIYPGTWPELPVFSREIATLHGVAANLADPNAGGFTRYAVTYDGFLQVPDDGGYIFHLLARDGARVVIDGMLVTQTGPPFGEVCGSPVNAVRYARGTIGLHAGKHVLHVESLQSVSPFTPRILWEGPGIGLTDVPSSAFSHLNVAAVRPTSGQGISTAHP